MKTLTVQNRKRMSREVCRGRRRTSRRRRVTHPSIVSRRTAPPHRPSNTPRGQFHSEQAKKTKKRETKRQAEISHSRVRIVTELSMEVAARAATGKGNKTVTLALPHVAVPLMSPWQRSGGFVGRRYTLVPERELQKRASHRGRLVVEESITYPSRESSNHILPTICPALLTGE